MVMAHGSGLDRAALETDNRRAWRGKVLFWLIIMQYYWNIKTANRTGFS